jgi:anti-sigma B factor antagonist
MSFAVTTESPAHALYVVAPGGEIDAFTAPRLRTELAQVVDAGATAVVCDLSAVTFLDSSGLGVLIGALKRLRQAGGELLIVLPAPSARKVFSLTALDRILPLFETREEALAAAQGP